MLKSFNTQNLTLDLLAVSTVRTLIEDLANIEKIKTWSLIVTMFGDLDECHPQSLSGKEIGAILGHIGIKPEAVRVGSTQVKKGRLDSCNKVWSRGGIRFVAEWIAGNSSSL